MRQTFAIIFKKIQENMLECIFFLFLYISQFYYIYRYIFRINSTATSPSYTNGGIFEKVLKYIITIVFFCISIGIILVKKRYKEQLKIIWMKYKRQICVIVAFICYIVINLLFFHIGGIKAIKSSTVYDFTVKFIVFIPILFLSPFVYAKQWKNAWRGFFITSLLTNAIFTLIQIILYITLHRLPALAYIRGSVRFGGIWDDPNGISLFYLLILISFVFDNWKKLNILRYVAIALVVILLYLAISFTAFSLLFALLLFFFIYKHWKEGVFIIIIATLVVFISAFIPHYIENNFLLKIPSASQHLYEITHIKSLLITHPVTLRDGQVLEPAVILPTVTAIPTQTSSEKKTLTNLQQANPTKTAPHTIIIKDNKVIDDIFGHPNLEFSENFYKQIFYNFGLIGVFMLIWIYIEAFLEAKVAHLSPVTWSFVALTILGSFGLPYLEIFPVNLYFWIFLGFLLFH